MLAPRGGHARAQKKPHTRKIGVQVQGKIISRSPHGNLTLHVALKKLKFPGPRLVHRLYRLSALPSAPNAPLRAAVNLPDPKDPRILV